MDLMLMLFMLLCSSGLQAEEKHNATEPDDVRLVGGANRCAGRLEVKHQEDWRPVGESRASSGWTLKATAVVCRELDCGSAVSTVETMESSGISAWYIEAQCLQYESTVKECVLFSGSSSSTRHITCSESVRLVNGNSLCSGRVEVKSNQLWSSVCEADFDQQDAEVVCRELGCGAPSVLQGALYGEVEAPMWTKEFRCEGNESVLLDCGSSGSVRNTCSPDKAVGLTCSEPDDVRLVGGASRCAGRLEVKHQGDWRPVVDYDWTLKAAAAVCRQFDCGSAVSVEMKLDSERLVWKIKPNCLQSKSTLRECIQATYPFSSSSLKITCSESVRLVNGNNLCSGRVEVKSNQLWSSVCEADFDQQDAEVVCRELGCGAPSVLQGALYGEVEAPMWTKEFRCEGSESVLLDCGSSGSVRNTCSPDKAVGLTCSEPDDVRLVGGASRCAGRLDMKHMGDWKPVLTNYGTLKAAAVVCRWLDCGSAVSTKHFVDSSSGPLWGISSSCLQPGSTLRECVAASVSLSYSRLEITCSESVRLVNGNSLCSGRVEVKSNQSWSSVCEADFDQQDAEVVCRELGCGAPSVLQGALYGEVEAPMWTKEFRCEGSESVLLGCGSSGSVRNTCSPGKAVGLTCSELDDVRLVGGASRCAGRLEVKYQGQWRPAGDLDWTLQAAAVVCRQLDCGSAVSTDRRKYAEEQTTWWMYSSCDGSESALRECVEERGPIDRLSSWEVICSDLLLQPNISLSPSMNGVSEAQQQGLQVLRGSNFTISCSIQSQYPGGIFHLTFTSSNTTVNRTLPAVHHSAHFLFPAAEPAHQGKYSCVYHISVFSHQFSSESQPVSLTVSVSASAHFIIIIRLVASLLTVLLIATFCFYCKANSRQRPERKENIELDYYNTGGSSAEGEPGDEAAALGTE